MSAEKKELPYDEIYRRVLNRNEKEHLLEWYNGHHPDETRNITNGYFVSKPETERLYFMGEEIKMYYQENESLKKRVKLAEKAIILFLSLNEIGFFACTYTRDDRERLDNLIADFMEFLNK